MAIQIIIMYLIIRFLRFKKIKSNLGKTAIGTFSSIVLMLILSTLTGGMVPEIFIVYPSAGIISGLIVFLQFKFGFDKPKHTIIIALIMIFLIIIVMTFMTLFIMRSAKSNEDHSYIIKNDYVTLYAKIKQKGPGTSIDTEQN
jgi:CDP-diglyceride synthetase